MSKDWLPWCIKARKKENANIVIVRKLLSMCYVRYYILFYQKSELSMNTFVPEKLPV